MDSVDLRSDPTSTVHDSLAAASTHGCSHETASHRTGREAGGIADPGNFLPTSILLLANEVIE
jgi:hypothetical protein